MLSVIVCLWKLKIFPGANASGEFYIGMYLLGALSLFVFGFIAIIANKKSLKFQGVYIVLMVAPVVFVSW